MDCGKLSAIFGSFLLQITDLTRSIALTVGSRTKIFLRFVMERPAVVSMDCGRLSATFGSFLLQITDLTCSITLTVGSRTKIFLGFVTERPAVGCLNDLR